MSANSVYLLGPEVAYAFESESCYVLDLAQAQQPLQISGAGAVIVDLLISAGVNGLTIAQIIDSLINQFGVARAEVKSVVPTFLRDLQVAGVVVERRDATLSESATGIEV